MNQKDAVFSAVMSVLNDAGITVEEGSAASTYLTREMRARVNAILVEGFNGGSIELATKFETVAELKAYASGLVSNWLSKDTRLNGGISGKIVSRRSISKDPQIQALNKLLDQTSDDVQRNEILGYISARTKELQCTTSAS